MSLKLQMLLAPGVVILLVFGLILFTLVKVSEIRSQNETVQEWVQVCSHSKQAIDASRRLEDLAARMRGASLQPDDDLHFNYLEESRALADHLLAPVVLERLSPESRDWVLHRLEEVNYRDDLDPDRAMPVLHDLGSRLTQLYRGFWAQKRAAYTSYYENVNRTTAQLVSVSLTVLALTVITGVALTVWSYRQTRRRLGRLARDARQVCSGGGEQLHAPEVIRDEVDEVAWCMSAMTRRLVKVVAGEKLLQGAEAERARIARDMHDQTLSDLTALARCLREAARGERSADLDRFADEAEQISNHLRGVIDDLHPQTLELLGLATAMRAHLERRVGDAPSPRCLFHLDPAPETQLDPFQSLAIYRIYLAVVDNALRHARCSRIEVELRREGAELILNIEDDGIGFDPAEAMRRGGHGLTNIQQRARALGAEVEWGAPRFASGSRFTFRMALRAQHPSQNASETDRDPAPQGATPRMAPG